MFFARYLCPATISRVRPTASTEVSVESSRVIGPNDDFATITSSVGVCRNERTNVDVCERRVSFWPVAVKIAPNENGTSAGIARRVYACGAGQRNSVSQHINSAASRTSVHARRLKRAADAHHASITAIENNLAIALDQRVGTDGAAVIDDGIEQRISAARG